jgi:hypothetical protein
LSAKVGMLEQVSGLGVDLEGILGFEEVRVEERADHSPATSAGPSMPSTATASARIREAGADRDQAHLPVGIAAAACG